jgi:hypothetical protein
MEQRNGPIFIGGVGRSGTTLLRVMLDAHPNISCGPELKILPFIGQLHKVLLGPWAPSMCYYQNAPADVSRHCRRLIESFVETFRRVSGKPRWAEKTPDNVLHMVSLGAIFPDAQFLHVIRDGRDVACSLVTMHWINPVTGQKAWHTQSITNAARYWRQVVEAAHRQAAHPSLAGRVLEVRYERLVTEPERTLREVLEFLQEPWHDEVLHHDLQAQSHQPDPEESNTRQARGAVYRTSLGRWQREMTELDRAAFQREAGGLLEELGYASGQWPAPPRPNKPSVSVIATVPL